MAVLAISAIGAGATFVAWARSPGSPLPFRATTLRASSPGMITTHEAHVGSVYNLGVTLRVTGPDPVQFIDVTARDRTAGLEVLPGALLWGCDGAEVFGAVVASDLHRVRTARVADPATASLRDEDGSCWYSLLRLRPTRRGRFTASGGMVRYRTGNREESAPFDFMTVLDVTKTGRDPRDKTP